MRHGIVSYMYEVMPISCHFRDCKALLFESTHVSSATQTFTFTFAKFRALKSLQSGSVYGKR